MNASPARFAKAKSSDQLWGRSSGAVGGISDAAKHRHAREEKLRRHLASEQPRIGLFDHGMVWGVGSDDPSSETEAEQRDLVADDVRHDPVPGTLPGQDRAVRTGRADEFYRRPGPPALSRSFGGRRRPSSPARRCSRLSRRFASGGREARGTWSAGAIGTGYATGPCRPAA